MSLLGLLADLNPQPCGPKPDTLPTGLSRPGLIYALFNIHNTSNEESMPELISLVIFIIMKTSYFPAIQKGDEFSPLMSPTCTSRPDVLPDNVDTTVTVRMASLCYTHSPAFLRDFMQSIDDFKDYMSNVGNTLRLAAAEAAMGWVHKRTDLTTMSAMYGSMTSLDFDLSKRRGTFDDTTSLQEEEQGLPAVPSRMKFDVLLQSPVIMLPRKPNSPELLVGHLGNISIRNSITDGEFGGSTPVASTPAVNAFNSNTQLTEKIHMEIRDMNVYSVNLDKQQEELVKSPSSKQTTGEIPNITIASSQSGELAKSTYGTAVLHDTVIQLTIQKVEPAQQYVNPPDTAMDLDFGGEEFSFRGNTTMQPDHGASQDEASVLKVKGKVVSPLKLVLSKFNITPPDEDEEPPSDLSSPTSPKEKLSQSSLSALRYVPCLFE